MNETRNQNQKASAPETRIDWQTYAGRLEANIDTLLDQRDARESEALRVVTNERDAARNELERVRADLNHTITTNNAEIFAARAQADKLAAALREDLEMRAKGHTPTSNALNDWKAALADYEKGKQ